MLERISAKSPLKISERVLGKSEFLKITTTGISIRMSPGIASFERIYIGSPGKTHGDIHRRFFFLRNIKIFPG